jgi:hypothetical protein
LAVLLQRGLVAWMRVESDSATLLPSATLTPPPTATTDHDSSVSSLSDQLTRLLVEMLFHCSQEVRA